jgi:hypothetical protein
MASASLERTHVGDGVVRETSFVLNSINVEAIFPSLVAARSLDGAADPASVMHSRVDRWAQAATSRRRAETNRIAGLIPRALGVTDLDMARALHERDVAMQRRARDLAAQALERGQPWARRLGAPPADPSAASGGSNPSRPLPPTATA